MAKFSGFEKNRPETLEFCQNRRIWAVWGAKMAKFSGFEKTGLKPLNFIRIAEFELFGEPKWLNLAVLKKTGLNLAVLKKQAWNPWILSESQNLSCLGLAVLKKTGLKPLNFIKIAEFELFGEPKMLNLAVLKKNRPEALEFYQNRRIWGAKMAKFSGFEKKQAWNPWILSESENLRCLGSQNG